LRFYEFRQSATSPKKYRLELSEEEVEIKKVLSRLAEIIQVLHEYEQEQWRNKKGDIDE